MTHSYKLLFGIQTMILYCVQMMYLYLAKNLKHSHTGIFGVDVNFRTIGMPIIIIYVIITDILYGANRFNL